MLKDLPADLMRELEAVTAKAMFDEPAFAATEAGRHEIYVHLVHRLTEFRNNVMPWLGKHMTLDGARVLEIGAGTGSSVVALAESGAEVDAIDIMDNHLTVARTRVAMHGLQARIVACNAVDFPFAWGDYDLILLSATLEHMTLSERLSFLETAWKHLKARGLLGIYETPNRLWFRDDHTSQLPFFHWLTDEMAIAYARKSPRADFASSQLDVTRLARWGRGASFTRSICRSVSTIVASSRACTSSCATPTRTTAKSGMPRSASAISSFWARSSPASRAPGAKRC